MIVHQISIYYYKFQYIKEICMFIKISVCIHTQIQIYIHTHIYIHIDSGSSGISVLVYIGIICLKVYAYFLFSHSSINDFWIINKTISTPVPLFAYTLAGAHT